MLLKIKNNRCWYLSSSDLRFAWLPVRISDEEFVWLEWVFRHPKRMYDEFGRLAGYPEKPEWEYRRSYLPIFHIFRRK